MEDNQNQKTIDSELEIARKQAEEYLNNWKRERADFINYKKNEAKRVERTIEFAKILFVEDFLSIKDGLEEALKSSKPGDEYYEGIKIVVNEFERLLKKYRVEKIDTSGDFDPSLHEAIEMEPEGVKIEELVPGYTINGEVIRPARVKITK